MKEFVLTAKDGLRLSVALFDIEEPKALVQLIHGQAEHKERYYELCRYLNEKGYSAIICDNRGHGASIDRKYTLGYMDGFKPVIEDLVMVSEYFKVLNPGKDLYMLGHSLGSVFARIYLERNDTLIKKLILSGTVPYQRLAPLGIFIAHCIILFKGKRDFSMLLRKFIKNGNDITWVSYNEKNLFEYMKDPLCGFPYTNNACLTVMESIRELVKTKHFLCQNQDLPIFSITGKKDIVVGGKCVLQNTFSLLRKSGYYNFSNKRYSGMKHEILNEYGKLQVFADIVSFFDD